MIPPPHPGGRSKTKALSPPPSKAQSPQAQSLHQSKAQSPHRSKAQSPNRSKAQSPPSRSPPLKVHSKLSSRKSPEASSKPQNPLSPTTTKRGATPADERVVEKTPDLPNEKKEKKKKKEKHRLDSPAKDPIGKKSSMHVQGTPIREMKQLKIELTKKKACSDSALSITTAPVRSATLTLEGKGAAKEASAQQVTPSQAPGE